MFKASVRRNEDIDEAGNVEGGGGGGGGACRDEDDDSNDGEDADDGPVDKEDGEEPDLFECPNLLFGNMRERDLWFILIRSVEVDNAGKSSRCMGKLSAKYGLRFL